MAKDKQNKRDVNISQKATTGELNYLHDAVARYMVEQLESGEDLSSGDVSNILKFLKDNNIAADISESKPMNNLSSRITDLLRKES